VNSRQHGEGTIGILRSKSPTNDQGDDRLHQNDETDESLHNEYDILDEEKEDLLAQANNFQLPFDSDRGFRGTELHFWSYARPHMRAFHASWICYFTSFFVQFSQAPLLPEIQDSLALSKSDIWWTNLWMMLGGVPMRFLLGPLCDKYGARSTMTVVVALAAIPAALTGLVATDLTTLTVMRLLLGAMDSFVPGQYWITCMFVREVGGTAMAITGGLGAVGSGVTQLVTGSVIFPLVRTYLTDGESDMAWRLSLLVPAVVALVVAWYFYVYSDDCPLGNYQQVKKAGLMIERSAMDSFRQGAYNMNSWILCIQYMGSCGVDFTMCNGTAIYYHSRFEQSIAASAAIGFLYGVSAAYARALGGWLSDAVSHKFSLQGRLWANMLCLVAQAIVNLWFARTNQLTPSLLIMVAWSILIQMSSGTTYGIVPYVDGPNTGSVAGIVGAGGNVGAAILAVIFMKTEYEVAMEAMGYLTLFTALLTPFLVIPGYRGILFGKEASAEENKQHSPLLVPGKLSSSPHLVSLKKRALARKRQQK